MIIVSKIMFLDKYKQNKPFIHSQALKINYESEDKYIPSVQASLTQVKFQDE